VLVCILAHERLGKKIFPIRKELGWRDEMGGINSTKKKKIDVTRRFGQLQILGIEWVVDLKANQWLGIKTTETGSLSLRFPCK
jgi:hypothetical protein